MYVALGFCTAGLIGLAILPAFYRRASRLTEEALRAVNPASYAEVRAAQDQERARYAIELRRVEMRLDKEREKATRFHLDATRMRSEIEALTKTHKDQIKGLEARLANEDSDRHAVDMLSAEVKMLKQKLSEAEKALAESWKKPAGETVLSEETADVEAKDVADWLPATDTMALATITGLEAEVATLRTKLSRYEPTVAGEVEAERSETARTRLAELEAQLVDVESQYVAAQAEVTRLSLMLEAAGASEATPDERLRDQLRKMTGEIEGQRSELKQKDRALQRLTGQMQKLRDDLAAVPELKDLRKDFRALSERLSQGGSVTVGPDKAAPEASDTGNLRSEATASSGDTTRSDGPGAGNGAAGEAAPPAANGGVAPVAAPRSSDIASAAEALVSRIVATSRSKSEGGKEAAAATASGTPASSKEQNIQRKSKSAKQKKKDVA
ncbi:MAG: hypothetical protein Tsb0019_14320 [Roseibium sp.]